MYYKVRDLIKLPLDDLWNLPDGQIQLEFDDGVIQTTMRETIFSVYLMEFHRRWPKTPALKDRHHIGGRWLDSTTHLKLLENGMWDAYEAYGGELDIEELSRIAYETTNRLYNDFTYRLEAYVNSINILDFLDVLDHPEVAAANREVKPNRASIARTHDRIEAVLKDPNELKGNSIARGVKSRLVSLDQTLQCVGPRGYIADIDSTIFRYPILTGYVEGLRGHYELLIESRSAARALLFSRDQIKDSEYLNRQLQLLCATFRRVHGVSPQLGDHNELLPIRREWRDCGSTTYRPFTVRSNDLETLSGKYYLNSEGGLSSISPSDRHLIGKTIQLRSILDCQLPDPNGCCATCFGDIALNIPGYTNVGHVSASVLGELITQNLLSTKHLERSSTVVELPLTDFDKKFIRLGLDANTIRLSPDLNGKQVKLLIKADEAKNLSDIRFAKSIRDLTLSRVTELTDVTLEITHRSGSVEEVTVPVSVGSRRSSLNHMMLEYIRQHGWEVNERNEYVIDLKDWDREEPIFELAFRNINTVDFMKEVERIFKSTGRKSDGRGGRKDTGAPLKSYQDPWAAVVAFYEFVNGTLSVNLAHLELVVYCIMVVSAAENNYWLPRPGTTYEIEKFHNIMSMRSMAVLLSFQGHAQAIYDIRSYTVTDRPSHPMDILIVPS